MDGRIPVRFEILYAEDTIKVTSRNNTSIQAPTDTDGQYTSTGPEHSSRERAFVESNDAYFAVHVHVSTTRGIALFGGCLLALFVYPQDFFKLGFLNFGRKVDLLVRLAKLGLTDEARTKD